MNAMFHFACATCINTADSTGTSAANGAVFVMMGALGLVFLTFIGILFSFVRRARRYAAQQSPAA
jgi:heme/copper-type cytochrome/quinol oxidase subunit 2